MFRKKEFCCNSLKSNFENSDQRGFSIKRRDNENAPLSINFNVVEDYNEKDLVEILRKAELPKDSKITNYSLFGELAIKFCPWCGTKLSKLDLPPR